MVLSADGTAVSAPEDTASELRFGRLNEEPGSMLGELRDRLAALAHDQRDVVVSTRELAMAPVDSALMVGGSERYTLREHAFGQLAAKLGIPAPYLRRCDPDLRARNVNRWLRETDRDVMLRFEGGEVRGVLSGSYRVINHLDILGWLESRLGANTQIRCELTEGYLDMQVVGDHETGMPEARRDPLHRGLHLRNSEVGLARVNISALVFRTICLNGLVMGAGRWAYQRRHVGKAEIADQVREAFDHAIELSAQAATAFAGTRGIQVKEPEKALDRIVTRYELAEDEHTAVNRAYQIEPGQTLYNVINALTRAGNDNVLTLESRHKLQTLGGRLTDLSATGRWIDN
ncbi:MAG: DUF932 domain-containing protein [Planctomycetes bacterium]|nr:DUF932 domain-containing protein [Planctomycetota bacterium]